MAADRDGGVGGLKLDRANRGPMPPAIFLRAIRHGVAAGACRLAARATGRQAWHGRADRQSQLAVSALGHAAARSATPAKNIWGVSGTPSAVARSSKRA